MPVTAPSWKDPLAALAAAFAASMARLGPFEPAPHLAVALSGGPDSLALLLAAVPWAVARAGAVTALVVDHRMRAGSGAEAEAAAAAARALGAAAVILAAPAEAPPPRGQDAARALRHGLLEDWCRTTGVLHLLLGQHRDDQAETVLLRLAAGSGPDGLAAMPALEEGAYVRRLRPLLGIPKADLVAACAAAGLAPADDPSNRSPAYARARLRRAAAVLQAEGLTSARLAATAARAAAVRAHLDAETAAALVPLVLSATPAGDASPVPELDLDLGGLVRLPRELGLRALAAALRAIGGRAHPVTAAAERAYVALLPATRPRTMTAGGCVLRCRGGRLEIRRDPRAAATAAAALLAPPFMPG